MPYPKRTLHVGQVSFLMLKLLLNCTLVHSVIFSYSFWRNRDFIHMYAWEETDFLKCLGRNSFNLRRNLKFFILPWGAPILDPKWRLFEAIQQEQNQKFYFAIQLKWATLKYKARAGAQVSFCMFSHI